MGMGAMKQSKTKTLKKWTIDEIYEILKSEGQNLPSEPYIKGEGMMRGLFVKGIGKYDVSISIMGKSIVCCEYVRKGEQAKNIGLSFLTSGWTDILDKDSKENVKVVMQVGEEIKRLFENRE